MWLTQLSHVMQQRGGTEAETAVQATAVTWLTWLDDLYSLSNTDILYTYTSCLKGWECAINSRSMQWEPSPILHTASKMSVSSSKQWLYLICVLYPFGLSMKHTGVGRDYLCQSQGPIPACPWGAVASCHPWWGLWAYIWRWNLAHAKTTFTCLTKENRCMAASCKGTHCSMGHVTRRAGASVQLAGSPQTSSWKDMGQWLLCTNWLLFCVVS